MTGIFEDDFGTWIAAIAPIYNSQDKVVGVAQVSRTVTERYDKIREQAWSEIRHAFITLLVCIIPATWMARRLLKPIRQLGGDPGRHHGTLVRGRRAEESERGG